MWALVGVKGWRGRRVRKPWIFINKTSTSLANDLNRFKDSPADDGGSNPVKQVVIVMDGLEEFTPEALQWALQNLVTSSGSIVTLLGVMPWLNIPLSTKTWLDVWSVELEEVASLARQKSEFIKSDFKYLKLKEVIDLCNNYGVVLQKKVVMGYPLRLLVVEQIISLNATWVVFDRHQRKTRFYAKKIPSNMVVMNHDGEADLIKGRPGLDSNLGLVTPSESPALLPTPKLIISDQLKGILKERSQNVNKQRSHQLKFDPIAEEDDDDKDVHLCV